MLPDTSRWWLQELSRRCFIFPPSPILNCTWKRSSSASKIILRHHAGCRAQPVGCKNYHADFSFSLLSRFSIVRGSAPHLSVRKFLHLTLAAEHNRLVARTITECLRKYVFRNLLIQKLSRRQYLRSH